MRTTASSAPQRRARPIRAFALRLLRVLTLGSVIAVGLGAMAARTVYGSVAKSVAMTSSEMTRTAKLHGSRYQGRINGERIFLASTDTPQTVKEVLDVAHAECARGAAGVDPGGAAVMLDAWSALLLGPMRSETTDGGSVACFVRSGAPGVMALLGDLRRVYETGDLANVGTLRFVQATRAAGTAQTHVLRSWTEGSFNLHALLPSSDDVPGADLDGVGRPAGGARRILAGSIDDLPLAIRVYEAPGLPSEILDRYETSLAKTGWRSIRIPTGDAEWMRVFDRGNSTLFVTATAENGCSVVSMAQLP